MFFFPFFLSVGWPLVFMAVESILCFLLVLLLEWRRASPGLFRCCSSASVRDNQDDLDEEEIDLDVRREKARLQAMPKRGGKSDTIQLRGLRKVYEKRPDDPNSKRKIAVRDLWFGVEEGQCMGFLGINGAGKSTTLSMLTGETFPTSGTATLGGFDILSQQGDVRRQLGFW